MGKIYVLPRSNEEHADVSAIAKMLGGGGHRNASGCGADTPLWAAKFLQWLKGARRCLT